MSNISEKTWAKERGYIWSMIGSAVGFANILSFSALCYRNGGGAFLIPYLIAHLLIGIPMLYLEGTIGQKTKLPLVSALGVVGGSKGKLLGWFSVITCATIGGFYMVLTGFSVAYSYFSSRGMIPSDTAAFFKDNFLHDSGSLTEIGGVAGVIFVSTLIVAIFTWIILSRNIRSGIEKICTIFLPLLAILIVAFTTAICFLPGAFVGFKNYLIPDFSRLANWTLWRDVFGQVFFSLSLGLGIVVGYSRHNKDTFSIRRAMMKVAIGDVLISIIAGFAIFGCIGFMSVKSGIAFNALIPSDSAFEIGFVVFPKILQQFGVLSNILGPIFFFCVFIAGITGVFSIIESVAGSIEVEFNKSRKTAVAISMAVVTLLAFPFCLGNGQHLLSALAPMVLGNALLLGGIFEILYFLFLSKEISRDPIWNNGRSFSYRSLQYFVLPVLLLSFLGAFYKETIATPLSLATLVWMCWVLLALIAAYLLSRRRVSYAEKSIIKS